MNGYYGGFAPQPMGYMQMQPPPLAYGPTRYPPDEAGFVPGLWAFMVVKQKGKTYSDLEWKYLVETLAKCDQTDYYMEVKGISMSSHVWFKDPYFLNKMMATQSGYDPDHPVTRYNVEIKSQFHEMVSNLPELEIRHVRDRNTPDVIYDTLSYHFISGGVIHSIRIGERQPQEQTMTVYVKFFAIETYLEAFLPHIKNLKHWIDPTNIRIKGIPSGGRRIFDMACEFIRERRGMIFDTKFKDRPEGCDCYVRVPLPAIAEDIRNFDWRDPDVPLELQGITTNSPSYALWGASGKPPGSFVEKNLNGYIQFNDLQIMKAQLQQRCEMQIQQFTHPVYNPVQVQQMHNANGYPPMGYAPAPMMGNATPYMGHATPFQSMGGNNMAGNATPYNSMAGNATPFNAFNTYAGTPFNSFSLENQAPTAVDPRFPVPMMDDLMPAPAPENTVVDTSFSKRAHANSKKPSTATRGGHAARRGSTRAAPVLAGSRRNSKPENDRNDTHDSAIGGGDADMDRYETGSQKSTHSRKSGSGKQSKPVSADRRSDAARVSISQTAPIHHLFPWNREEVDEKTRMEEELAGFRKAYANSIAWNAKPEARKRRRNLEQIIQPNIEERNANRRALYEMLNELNHEQDSGHSGAGEEILAGENGEVLS